MYFGPSCNFKLPAKMEIIWLNIEMKSTEMEMFAAQTINGEKRRKTSMQSEVK